MALGTGCGKILLFGEHVAVYGAPAVGKTLDMETKVEFAPGGDRVHIEGVAKKHVEAVTRLISAIRDSLELPPDSIVGKYRVRSTVPAGLGLGSSAALAAAMTRAVAGEYFPQLSVPDLWRAANEGEKLFHGTPSGIDTGLALLNGFYSFTARQEGLPEVEKLPGIDTVMLLATTPRTGSTDSLVSAIKERIQSDDSGAKTSVNTLRQCARSAIDLARSGERDVGHKLGGLADEAHAALADLGLSTWATDRFLEEGRRNGALGGKISGAGGGGACFLLYHTTTDARNSWRVLQDLITSQNLPIKTRGILTLP